MKTFFLALTLGTTITTFGQSNVKSNLVDNTISEDLNIDGELIINDTSYKHSVIRLGKNFNDNIFSDNSPDKFYGGGIFFRVHNENAWMKYIDALLINDNGNVGIGSKHPNEKLTVKGKIHAEEVIIDLNIPADYVFQKYYTGKSDLKADYVFPKLNEIETFVKQNNHLPGVPSAKEIQENGLKVGEMNNLLLQKIEELTLLLIEQNKITSEQEKRILELEKNINH